ncbi:MAG: hypothetical protein LBS74_00160 [Oscillospiraceae bacterium]|jgi:hypothetical protein|nr:hypothetical protein [Oscillospiraceae bacterium]
MKKLKLPPKKWIIPSVIALVLLIIIGTGITLYVKGTRDVLPAPPLSYTEPSNLGGAIAKDVLLKSRVVIKDDEFNGLLAQTMESCNKSLAEQGSSFVISELFGKVRSDDIIIYCRAKSGSTPVYATLTAVPRYISPDIELVLTSFKIGELDVPVSWVSSYVSKKKLPKDISVSGERICYDTTNLKQIIIEEARKNSTVNQVEGFVTGVAGIFNINFKAEEMLHLEITEIRVEKNQIIIRTRL